MAVARQLPVVATIDKPVIRAVPEAGEDDHVAITDASFYRTIILGSIVGTIVLTAISFAVAVAGGISAEAAFGLAPVPGVVAGVFFGGNALLGRALAKAERQR